MKPSPMNPLVSIIIPTYNAKKWLREAVDSALAQTYTQCEVIVVDDGSTDGTREWLTEAYGQRIRYVHQVNGGTASARNLGLKHARGEFIQFLDSDDLLGPEKVASHVECLVSNPEVDIPLGRVLWFYDNRPDCLFEWDRMSHYQAKDFLREMVYEGFILIHSALSRRACLDRVGGFDESLSDCEDWDYWLRVAYSGARFAHPPGPAVVYYRVREGYHKSLSLPDHALNGLRVLEKVGTYVVDPKERRRIGLSRAKGHWRFRYGRALAEHGRLAAGLWHMAKGTLADPQHLRYKLLYMMLAIFVGPRKAGKRLERLNRAKGAFEKQVESTQFTMRGTGGTN